MSWLQDKQRREKWVGFVRSLSPEIDPRAVSLMDELGAVARAIYHVGDRSLDEAGLSLAQYRVLLHLLYAEQVGDSGQLNPSQISDRQGVSRNTMSALIRSLEDDGFVARRLDAEDRRRFNISLTRRGRELVKDHARQHLAVVDSCFSVLTSTEQAALLALLRKVGEHVPAVRERT